MEQEKITVATDKALDDVIIYQEGLCMLSVCALKSLSIEDVTYQVNCIRPTGIDSEWKLSKGKFLSPTGTEMNNPCPCNTDPLDRRHYLFEC